MEDNQIKQAIRDLYPEYAHLNINLVIDLIHKNTCIQTKQKHMRLHRHDTNTTVNLCPRTPGMYDTYKPTELYMLLAVGKPYTWTSTTH